LVTEEVRRYRFKKASLPRRNLTERYFNRIKHCRRAATRYEKLAVNFLAMVKLASVRLWLAN
jgi:transposase